MTALARGLLLALPDDEWAGELAVGVSALDCELRRVDAVSEALAHELERTDLVFVLTGPSVDDDLFIDLARAVKLGPHHTSLPLVRGVPNAGLGAPSGKVVLLPDAYFDCPASGIALVKAELPAWRERLRVGARRVELKGPSDAQSTQRLKAVIEQFYQDVFASQTDFYKALSAFREAIDNSAVHGNDSSPERYLNLTLVQEPGQIRLEVRDEGAGFDGDSALAYSRSSQAADAARERIREGGMGGLGLKMILECADEVRFEDGGRRIIVIKRFS